MRTSLDPAIIARSTDPVEGNSEIDVVIEAGSFIVYPATIYSWLQLYKREGQQTALIPGQERS